MARTYDIEISIPSMNGYKEVSSVSNARDYQARRGNMRVRRADRSIQFMHTLNGSGLATSRDACIGHKISTLLCIDRAAAI